MNKFIFPLVIFIFFVLVIILIINIHERNKIVKRACVLFFTLCFIAITFYDETVLDQFIYYIIKYIYYPSYHIYIFTILFMILVFIYSVFSEFISNKMRVFNYAFGGMAIVSYIIFLLSNVNVGIYKSLYSGTSLICLRVVSRGFVIWITTILFIKYYEYFMRKE